MARDKYTWKQGQVTLRDKDGNIIDPKTMKPINNDVYKEATKAAIKQENKKKKANG